jgi:lipooligosaccharide transport system permease protein
MFLFSATFFPLSTYPDWLEIVVQATPLYHGVELLRALTLGTVDAGILWHVAYLAGMVVVGLTLADRRLERRLLK